MSIIDNINRQSTRTIDYSSAPVMIYSNFNPERQKPEGGFVTAIAFRGAEPRVINGVLTRLTQSIREAKRPALAYEEISLQIESFMKDIKLEVNLWNILVYGMNKPPRLRRSMGCDATGKAGKYRALSSVQRSDG